MKDNRSQSTPVPPRASLTSIEKQLLELLAQGWTAREAASHVNLGVWAVTRHIEILRLKMNAQNTPHLIARAFSNRTLKIVNGVARITNSVFEPQPDSGRRARPRSARASIRQG